MSGIETAIEEVHVDVPRVQAIARRVAAAAAHFTATARPLRLASGAPATDPVSLTLTAHANARRLEVGLIGEAAAIEVDAHAEFVVAGALHVATLGSAGPNLPSWAWRPAQCPNRSQSARQ